MITRVLIANRGEIACRIARTCRRLGIETVAVFSDADGDAVHVRACDRAVRLPGTLAADTYLRDDLLVEAARRAGADAVHPGYGFLAESADFAARVTKAGLVWVGPPAEAIAAMGSKIEAKATMRAAGVPVLPDSAVADDPADLAFPLLVKASAGGGGRGMRVVEEPVDLADALADASREAAAAFGDGTVFCERYVRHGRHVEIQIVADELGHVAALPERECSIQRRHQKILEESPSPAVAADLDLRTRMSEAAIAAARAIAYVGAGTVEFLLEPDGRFWFLEMNTRLQVEHPVTELVTGLDLVELQFAVAEGDALPTSVLTAPLDGHAIEARLTAEDPAAGYRPSTGSFTRFEIPTDAGVRVDSGVATGSTVSPYYDSLVAKVITHGPTREAARRTLVAALRRCRLEGPVTNRDQLVRILEHDAFRDGDLHTDFLAEHDTTAPLMGRLDVAAAAVALAESAANRAAAPVLRGIPAGWRNNPAVVPSLVLTYGDTTVTVRHVLAGGPRIEVGFADLEPAELVDLRIGSWTADHVELDVDGVRQVFEIGRDGSRRYVHGPEGQATFDVLPRFPIPGRRESAGSLVAPMPGTVRQVSVAAGAAVSAGQVLAVIEAMKMEHPIVAPEDGRVAEVMVAPGDQVETGEVLLRLTEA